MAKSAVTATASPDRRRFAGTVFRRRLETMRTSPTTRNRYRRSTTIREGLSSHSSIFCRKRSDGAPASTILVYWYDHRLLRLGRQRDKSFAPGHYGNSSVLINYSSWPWASKKRSKPFGSSQSVSSSSTSAFRWLQCIRSHFHWKFRPSPLRDVHAPPASVVSVPTARRAPIKGNVKRKILPVGSMPIFFSRHSAQPIERPLREWSCSGPKVLARRCVRSGESILLPCGSISLL